MSLPDMYPLKHFVFCAIGFLYLFVSINWVSEVSTSCGIVSYWLKRLITKKIAKHTKKKKKKKTSMISRDAVYA